MKQTTASFFDVEMSEPTNTVNIQKIIKDSKTHTAIRKATKLTQNIGGEMASDHEIPAVFPHVLLTVHRAAREKRWNLMRDYKQGH